MKEERQATFKAKDDAVAAEIAAAKQRKQDEKDAKKAAAAAKSVARKAKKAAEKNGDASKPEVQFASRTRLNTLA